MENELIKLFREQLDFINRFNKKMLVCHRDYVQEALRVIGKTTEDCIFDYLEENLVAIIYWE